MRTSLIIFIFLFCFSCAKNPAEETAQAIDIALTHLSKDECDEALKVLLEIKDSSNPIYLQVLSSAHACKASFNEVSFISSDLGGMNTSGGPAIFKSMATLSLSVESSVDSEAYTSVLSGINVLLTSTNGAPSQASRTSKFGPRKSGDMGIQALFLSIVNLGKFLNYFGDAGADGTKGGKNSFGASHCFIDYNDPRARGIIDSNAGGDCVAGSYTNGHPDLDQSTAAGKRRLCEGLMLFTNIIDILNNISLGSSTDLAALGSIKSEVNTIKDGAEDVGLGTLINMTSQSECETYLETAANLNDMEFLYASLFEQGLL